MNRNRTRLSILLGVFTLAATSGCTKTAQTAPPIFAVPVTVAKVTQKTVPIDLTAIGSADANSSVSIKAQVNAVLDEVHIKEGQFVKKGQLLFTLDAAPFEAALEQAQGNLAKDKAQEELDNVQANRYEQLYKAGVAPKEQLDTMKANADAQQAAVRADQAAVDAAKLQVGYCKIYSPIDGQTGALQVYPGNIVKAERRARSDRDQSGEPHLHRFLDSRAVSRRSAKIHGATQTASGSDAVRRYAGRRPDILRSSTTPSITPPGRSS